MRRIKELLRLSAAGGNPSSIRGSKPRSFALWTDTGKMRRASVVRRTGPYVVTMGFDLAIAPYANAVRYRRFSRYGGELVIEVIRTDPKNRNRGSQGYE